MFNLGPTEIILILLVLIVTVGLPVVTVIAVIFFATRTKKENTRVSGAHSAATRPR